MIRSTLAIAVLALRSAIRSRLVLCLLAALAAGWIVVPRMVHGDGTLAGRVHVTLVYSLGYSAIMLSLATLWAACRLIADDVRGRQICLVAVKPIRRVQVWLGKWLGLLAMNAVLLAGTALWTGLTVAWTMRSAEAPAAEKAEVRDTVLSARVGVLPRETLSDEQLHVWLDRFLATRTLPEDVPAEIAPVFARLLQDGQALDSATCEQVFPWFRTVARRRLATVETGQTKRWAFAVPPGRMRALRRASSMPVTLQFHLSHHAMDRKPVSGEWRIGTADSPHLVRVIVRDRMERTHRLPLVLPAEAVRDGGPIMVEFFNGDADTSNRAVFQPDRPVELMFRQGGFAGNLARATLILFAKVALLAAAGLCVSAMFSFPVASFSAVAAMLMALLVHYLAVTGGEIGGCGHDHGHGHGESAFLHVGEEFARLLNVAIEPVMRVQTLTPLADGIAIGFGTLARSLLLLLGLYPALLGLAAGTVLNIRELGLPGKDG